MRVSCTTIWILAAAAQVCVAQGKPVEPAPQLVREVVYNELHDHDRHGYWRYSIEQHTPEGIRVSEQVETTGGPITRVIAKAGHPLDAEGQRLEETRLMRLMNSPAEQSSQRQAYADDEKRVGRILALLPDAFVFEEAGEENGCRHLHFRPNPNYAAHGVEARVFHGFAGDLWIDTRMKRLARLDGHLQENVDFGLGMLGRINKGSWFRMDRAQVSATEWKTSRLEVHMNGRALLFKTIARETSEVRGNFAPLPASLSVAQGARLLEQANNNETLSSALFSPATLQLRR